MKYNRNRTKKLAFIGLFASLAMLMSYIEFLLPPIFVAVPGIKVGLPNVIILYVLYSFGVKYAALVSFIRLALSAMLFGNITTLWYSLAGAVISLTLMALLKRARLFSEVGVSVVGGVSHNLGQIIVAVVLLDTPQIAYYMVVLAVTGTISGVFIGLVGALMLKRLPYSKIFKLG